jgi:hypothetical protein
MFLLSLHQFKSVAQCCGLSYFDDTALAEGHGVSWNIVGRLQFELAKLANIAIGIYPILEKGGDLGSQLPVFVTCNSALFYNLIIDAEGNAKI